MKCPSGKKYTECGSSCRLTCSDILYGNPKCDEKCVEGCSCPKGSVLSHPNGICIPEARCGCMHDGKVVDDGQQVMKKCNTW